MSGPVLAETSFGADDFVEVMRLRHEADGKNVEPSPQDRAACTRPLGEAIPARFDAIALRLAAGCAGGHRSFAFCDAVVNMLGSHIYADAVAQRATWPLLFGKSSWRSMPENATGREKTLWIRLRNTLGR